VIPDGSSPRITWRLGTVIDVVAETRRARTLVLDVPGWPGHRAGQHVDIRLTAEDGDQAEPKLVAKKPLILRERADDSARALVTIEVGGVWKDLTDNVKLKNGEVSPYLSEQLRSGDKLELRGPIGGYFVWDVSLGGPIFLVAGGSGIVPLMAMLRHRNAVVGTDDAKGHRLPARLLYSSRGWDEVIYRDELSRLAEMDSALEVRHTLTREQPQGWSGFKRRIDRPMLEEVAWPPSERPQVFVCGPTPLVESAAQALVELGHQPALIKTERFGPTGGSV